MEQNNLDDKPITTEIYIKEKGIIVRSEIIHVKEGLKPSGTQTPEQTQPQSSVLTPVQQILFNLQTTSNTISKRNTNHGNTGKMHMFASLSTSDQKAITELVVEYFQKRPELLENGNGYNPERWRHQRILAEQLGVYPNDIRTCLRNSGLVDRYPPQIVNGAQYQYIYDHLDELLAKYRTVQHEYLYNQPTLMGIPHFHMDIMFYLAGMLSKVSKTNYYGIARRVAELKLPVRGWNDTTTTKMQAQSFNKRNQAGLL